MCIRDSQRTGKVVDGHARVEEAITAGVSVPVLYVDLDEEEERFVLATLDPISALATYDADVVADLTDGLNLESEAVKDLLASAPPAVDLGDDWDGLGGLGGAGGARHPRAAGGGDTVGGGRCNLVWGGTHTSHGGKDS